MEHIFIGGAFFTIDKEDTDIFPFVVNIIKNNLKNVEVIQPTDIEDYREKVEKQNPNITLKELNRAMVDYDLDLVKTSKLMICDVTNKSTGLGIELGIIKQNNVPIELVARTGAKISNMVFGAFPDVNISYYSNTQELEKIILQIIKRFK